ncbi:MAG: hypothetical protein Q8L55_06740 [Phycisphaerales bacterium]|nr:hypothetical protein [Phycisphaerales bacterium]
MSTFATTAVVQQPAPSGQTDVAQSWGWSLLWLFILFLAGAMLLVVARWLFLGGRAGQPLGRSANNRPRPTPTASAWVEAGRRMQTPLPPEGADDLREEP